jgi:alpha,alpha-trehalose phosphorylase
MRYRGRIVHVEVHHDAASYSLITGDTLRITHHGEPLTVGKDPVTLKIPVPPILPPPTQPEGRVPLTRRGRGE